MNNKQRRSELVKSFQHKKDVVKKSDKVVKAIITKDIIGNTKVVRDSELEKYRIHKSDSNKIHSRQLKEEEFFNSFEGDNLVKPPYNLIYLWRFMELSTEHSSCVRQKASDVCGLGWEIVKAKKGLKNAKLSEKEELENFFQNCNPRETFNEISQNVQIDKEALENAYYEVIRGGDGKPKALYHLPGHTIRCTKDDDIFIQIRGGKKKIFRRFNTDKKDKVSKLFVQQKLITELEEFANGDTEKIKIAKQGWNFNEITSEIIQIKNYSARSSYYGIPEWLPSVGAILGNIQCRDYNLKFFENNGVPHYAIIIKGADLDEELENVIATFFSQEIRGDSHKTLIIPINSTEVEVTFEKLSTDIKDASFRMYRQDNRDEIIRAHRIPFSRMNVATPGKLGGGGQAREESETYKKSIITPKQLIHEHRINQTIIRQGFGITDWVLRFKKLDATDVETDMRIDTAYVKSGIKTINEARENAGLEPKEGGDRPFLNTATGMVFLDEMEEMTGGIAVGTNEQKEQQQVTEKALAQLNKTLEEINQQDEIGVLTKYIIKALKFLKKI